MWEEMHLLEEDFVEHGIVKCPTSKVYILLPSFQHIALPFLVLLS
jgi:hypothetical protein